MTQIEPYVVFDVEVLRGPSEVDGGWGNPAGMGFGTGVLWEWPGRGGCYHFYGIKDKDRLVSDIDAFTMAKFRIVGFNHIDFDYKVLLGNDYSGYPVGDVDLLQVIIRSRFPGVKNIKGAAQKYGRKVVHDGTSGLDVVCHATLGRGKIGDGAYAPEQIRGGDWAGVFAYNLEDVRLTRDLYLFGLRYGYVILGNNTRLEVDFR